MAKLLFISAFEDPTFLLVSIGTVFLAVSASVVGSFAYLRKRSLVGDAVAHAILPGIAVAFMLFETKNPLHLLGGALISGWLALFAIEKISSGTKLSADTATALVLSVFFGVGILLLTHIQHSGAGNQSGLDTFLFGKAAAMKREDLIVYSGVAGLLLIIVFSLFKELRLFAFNPEFAQSIGLPIAFLRYTLNSITVLAIAIGLQTVGVVLMAALLITPAAAARAWTDQLRPMLILAAFIGALGGLIGSYVSFSAPAMPTGPWVVMSLSVMALFSLFFAPKRGVLSRVVRQRANQRKILTENLLKAFYQLGEPKNRFFDFYHLKEILAKRDFASHQLNRGVSLLKKKGLILSKGEKLRLSSVGLAEARRVVRLHRLWEMYLTKRVQLKPDHIHPNAETMEHIITPELEAQLLKELDYPKLDPHQSPIPYEP
jgi:manganese/zinc/iron transport system permease protein